MTTMNSEPALTKLTLRDTFFLGIFLSLALLCSSNGNRNYDHLHDTSATTLLRPSKSPQRFYCGPQNKAFCKTFTLVPEQGKLQKFIYFCNTKFSLFGSTYIQHVNKRSR